MAQLYLVAPLVCVYHLVQETFRRFRGFRVSVFDRQAGSLEGQVNPGPQVLLLVHFASRPFRSTDLYLLSLFSCRKT